MTVAIFAAYAVGHLVLFCIALATLLARRTPATLVLVLVTAGLVYDNALLALGSSIGHGAQLQQLSVPRFFLHALTTPLLMLTGLAFLRRAGVEWSRWTPAVGALVLLTIVMIGWGFHADMVRLALEPQIRSGIVSYGNGATSGLPVAPIVTILVVIGVGVALWRAKAGPILLLAALFQLAMAALGDAIFVGGNLGELVLLAGFVATDRRLLPRKSA